MRYVSEIFKEKQNQIIRPPMKLYFEVDSDVERVATVNGETKLSLDETVAPVIQPKMCNNERYYAILGDGKGVDDANRICAPDNTGEIAMPDVSVPWGVAPYANANTEVIIGVPDTYYYNYVGLGSPNSFSISFKGGLIPQYVNVYYYANGRWNYDGYVDNTDLKEEVTYTPHYSPQYWTYFKLYNDDEGGRYQLNWVKRNYVNAEPVIFKNNVISSASINEETDLTSQTLPDYNMTVTCLDPHREYTPNSDYWEKHFFCGSPCFFKAGFIGTEYISLLYGKLTEQPSYSDGKITFKFAIDWNASLIGSKFPSFVNNSLNTGDIVDNALFKDIVRNLFDTYDVFHGEVDERGSECNYYGTVDRNEARQLVANAMGCFITAGIKTFDLHNTNDIQYKPFDKYVTRYDQSKNELISRPKVGSVNITRNEFTLSDRTFEAEALEPMSITSSSQIVYPEFEIPVWAYGKAELIDAQSSDPAATITLREGKSQENMMNTGIVATRIGFKSDIPTTIQPIVRFYEVDRAEYQETQTIDNNASETYFNDNILIANGYNAGKARRVAQFISGVPYEYEVDVVQDFTHELGDIIRLETEKNVFKTCVITGLKFNMPGSNGHMTCRKVFGIQDAAYALSGVENAQIFQANSDDGYSYKVLGTELGFVVIVKLNMTVWNDVYYIVLGATSMLKEKVHEHSTVKAPNLWITDDNKHVWKVYVINGKSGAAGEDTSPTVPFMDLGNDSVGTDIHPAATSAYAAIKAIISLYKEQSAESPVNYDSEYDFHS